MNIGRGHYNAKKKVNWNLFCVHCKIHGHTQKVAREDETADVFGLVETGQKSTHDPYDLNSIRTNLQTLAAQPNFTSKQYQKIVQLLNKEEKAVEMVNMADKYLPNFVQQTNTIRYEELQERVITDDEVPINDALDYQNIMNDLNQDVENDSLVNQDVVNDPVAIYDSLVSQDIVHEVWPRTSSRVSHPPVWMKEYVTNMTASMHPHSLANYASYNHLSPT
ncbi:hypothetical protein H5410_056855 [Solanum commersonii]|uniref:Uncharacterized protein n=1 Tax=Solanum commersonii TaxID=4109 RepID=A0A9J5WLC5_SOLCO|nr:hypothetical protein H5410_056855 [Solanum commersonii]